MELMYEQETKRQPSAVYTVTANCHDCYRCVRACPVKAIKVRDGQAQISDKLCISCGTCVRECPQHAKMIRSSLDTVRELIASGRPVVVSMAPSFPTVFDGWRAARVSAALRRLGFAHVYETAEGAKLITDKSFEANHKGNICTACPAVVNYVEKYRPELIQRMIPIASPMIAHGKMLKQRYPDAAVVFIGPCAAKKYEAERPENNGIIDAVLTFTELKQWLEDEEIDLATCPESSFETNIDVGDARLFPLQGGMLKTGNIICDGTNAEIMHLSGAEDVMSLLDISANEWQYDVVEPLYCAGGCINGPSAPMEKSIFARRQDVLDYAKSCLPSNGKKVADDIDCQVAFTDKPVGNIYASVSQAQINKVLESTGKIDPAMQLNCGACGYNTCIDNARAVVLGMAEPEMCMPYMRRMAQLKSDRIIANSPNAIVILDNELEIISMNNKFMEMFSCNNGLIGSRISYLVDDDGYEKLREGTEDTFESIRSKSGVKYHELLYALREEHQYVGIYSDVTKLRFDKDQMDLIKKQTLAQAKGLLDHQIRFSQEMAHFLGKTTAQSEDLLKRMMDLYNEDEV